MNNDLNNSVLTGMVMGNLAAQNKNNKEIARAIEKKALLDNGMIEEYKKMVKEDAMIAERNKKTGCAAVIITIIMMLIMLGISYSVVANAF